MNLHVLRALDRTWRTFLQTLLGYLTVAGGLGAVDWPTGLSAALLAALAALLLGLSDLPTAPGSTFADIAGRLLRTFCQTAAGFVTTATLISDVPLGAMLSASTLAALASVVTSIVTLPIGPKGTPELVGGRSAHVMS